MRPCKQSRSSARAPMLAAVLSFSSGCSHLGFQEVGEGVYVSRSSPGLEQAAEKISAARKEAKDSSVRPPELTVEVNSDSGIAPEEFRILVDRDWIRVEGGGTAGAFYGALALEKGLRTGQGTSGLQAPRVSPISPRRILRIGLALPGLSDRPDTVDWKSLLDAMAFARFNVLVAPCGHAFPRIVSLQRFPKAFDPRCEGASSEQARAFKSFLGALEDRHMRLILAPTDLTAPASFYRSYGAPGRGQALGSPLGKTYLKACLAELLAAYPQVAGVAVCREALRDLRPEERNDFVRAVYLDGLRASRRSATLFLEAALEDPLSSIRSEGEVEVVRETILSPSMLHGEWPPVLPKDAGFEVCGKIPWRTLTPTLPVSGQLRPLLERASRLAPAGLILDFLDGPFAAGANPYLWERERLFLTAYGTAAFRCPWEDEFTSFPWRSFDREELDRISEVGTALARNWEDLARLHSSSRGWSPLTATEAPGDTRGQGEPRDDSPFVSILEFAFSPGGDPRVVTIPEAVAAEIRGETVSSTRLAPEAMAREMLGRCQAALLGIRDLGFEVGRPLEVSDSHDARWLLLAELAAMAHLGAFHAHRIACAVHLVRHAAGLGAPHKSLARQEADAAGTSWREAQGLLTRLREACGDSSSFPDLRPWESEAARDPRLVEETLPDPVGFRFSALLKDPQPAGALDFASLAGVIHLGADIFNYPPQDLAGDSQILEAEEFHGAWKILAELPGYSGAGYISSGTSGDAAGLPATLRLTIPGGGRYHFWVRGLRGGGQGSPSVRLRVSGLNLKPTHEMDQGPRQFTWEKAGHADLPSGDTFIQIVDQGQGVEGVDAVVITRDGSWEPPAL